MLPSNKAGDSPKHVDATCHMLGLDSNMAFQHAMAAGDDVKTCSLGQPIAVISAAIQYGHEPFDLTLNGNQRW